MVRRAFPAPTLRHRVFESYGYETEEPCKSEGVYDSAFYDSRKEEGWEAGNWIGSRHAMTYDLNPFYGMLSIG